MKVLGQRSNPPLIIIDASISQYVDKEKFIKRYNYYFFPVVVNNNGTISVTIENFGDLDKAVAGIAEIELGLLEISFGDWGADYLGFSLADRIQLSVDNLAKKFNDDFKVITTLHGYLACALSVEDSAIASRELDKFTAACQVLELVSPALGKEAWKLLKTKDYSFTELVLLFDNVQNIRRRSLS